MALADVATLASIFLAATRLLRISKIRIVFDPESLRLNPDSPSDRLRVPDTTTLVRWRVFPLTSVPNRLSN